MMRRVPCAAAALVAGAAQSPVATPRHHMSSPAPQRPTPSVPTFGSSKEAYGYKKTFDLFRGVCVLQVIRNQFIATHSTAILKSLESKIGGFLTYQVLTKQTVFKHFCAGEHMHELKSSIRALEKVGVGSILDYAAEADDVVGEQATVGGMTALATKSDIAYEMSEATFDETMKLNLLCIGHASLMLPKTGVGFAAVKISGLCDPMLLARVSALQLTLRQAWVGFFQDKPVPPLEECRVVVGLKIKNSDRFPSVDIVRNGLRKKAGSLTAEEEDAMIKLLDPKGTGKVDYIKYTHVVTTALLNPSSDEAAVFEPFMKSLPRMTKKELELWKALELRAHVICSMAKELHVRVMFDAEQTFYQMAIDYLVRAKQRKYNVEEPLIYNTYQCYLTFMTERLHNDLARAEKEGWIWAGKMVRGAYMNQERSVAAANKYASPVWATIEETHACYHNTASHILDLIAATPNKKFGVLFGTHNKSTVEFITRKMQELPKEHSGNIAFAQLYGMCDHLTIPLAKAGHLVFKYVPYGPVKETILYLGRRAVENNAVLTGDRKEELVMMMRELRRRFFGG